MGLKESLFILFLLSIISFPFFFSKKEIKIEKKITLPSIEVKNGYFKKYTDLLQREGYFESLDFYNDNNFTTHNLKVRFLDKNDTKLYAKTLNFDGIYHFTEAKYITNQYTYLAKSGVYDEKKDKLLAYQFNFFNDKIDGSGYKMIYQNRIIFADDIFYKIKGLK